MSALESTETDISERAFVAFFDVVGIVERVCESKESHVGIADGVAFTCCWRDRKVAWREVSGVVSESSSELVSGSLSEEDEESSESEG